MAYGRILPMRFGFRTLPKIYNFAYAFQRTLAQVDTVGRNRQNAPFASISFGIPSRMTSGLSSALVSIVYQQLEGERFRVHSVQPFMALPQMTFFNLTASKSLRAHLVKNMC